MLKSNSNPIVSRRTVLRGAASAVTAGSAVSAVTPVSAAVRRTEYDSRLKMDWRGRVHNIVNEAVGFEPERPTNPILQTHGQTGRNRQVRLYPP